MGLNKKYDGYEAFDYLEEGVDYKEFDLVEEMYWSEPYEVPLTEEEEKKVEELVEKNVYISLHEHPFKFPKEIDKFDQWIPENRCKTAYEWLSHSYWDAIFDNLMDGMGGPTSKKGWKWNDIVYDLGMRLCDISHSNFAIHGKTVEDIKRAHDEGKLAIVPCIESSMPIENEVDRIDILHGLGIRMMGIVYSEANALASGLSEDRDGGLTHFGRAAVERMNKVGIAIDVSHASKQTALDVCEVTDKPIFITHAGARGIWDIKRLKSDEVIKACAETGGVLGIEAAPHSTLSKDHPRHSIDSYMDHFEYAVDLVGIDHVSFGPDTMYADHVGLHRQWLGKEGIEDHFSIGDFDVMKAFTDEGEETPEKEGVKGLENPTEGSHNIVRWLVKHGYSDEEIGKVMGGNTLRVLEEVW